MMIKDVIKKVMVRRNTTQTQLAEDAGYRNQSNIAMILKSGNMMKLDNLLRILNALECDLVVRDRKEGVEFIVD